VLLVISAADPTTFIKSSKAGHVVGVDVGYRMRPDGLRVALWDGDDGRHGELIIPHRMLPAMRHTEELVGIRDTNFDTAKLQLTRGLTTLQNPPEWLVLDTTNLSQWKSANKLARVSGSSRIRGEGPSSKRGKPLRK
jgi:hypothetical protein